MKRSAAVIGVLAVLLACGTHDQAPPAPTTAALGGTVVARVGAVTIERSLVEAVAQARNLDARAALDLLIEDALLAQGAQARGLDRRPDVKLALDRARARWVADGIQARANAKGLPSDEEVAALTAKHWQDFDAPAGLRVVHVVVLKKKGVPEDACRALAETIERAVHDAKTETEFEQAAWAVPRDKFDVRLEVLPAFAEDGRILEGGGAMDPDFVRAAFALKPGELQTGVVTTSFGWHVMRIIGRVAEKRVPLEERRQRFLGEAVFLRGKAEKDAIVAPYRKGTVAITIDPAAETLMANAYDGLR
jgi:hypothetical protein